MKAILATLLSFGLFITPAQAWNSYGHMEAACIAYQMLTPQKQARATALLKLNPMYGTWTSWIPSGTSAQDQNMMIFMLAATWPDEIKGLPLQAPPTNPVTGQPYKADGSSGGDNSTGSTNPTANQGYSDNSMHKYWHFVDNPFSTDGTALPPVPTPNAQDRIALFRNVIAGDSNDNLKSYDLTWLLHLVGDVHQPLHCTTCVSKAHPQGDAGGNDVKLGKTEELHGFWDDLLGTGSDNKILSKVISAAKKLPAAEATMAADANEGDWVNESFQYAQKYIYPNLKDNGDGTFTLASAAKQQAKGIAQQRIALAGARLANLINASLK